MLHDLTGQGEITRDVDFVIIGAGTAGLPTAVELARRTGQSVLCLESGGRHQEGETHPLNAVVQRGMVYQGASDGRFRCLGGTSTRWGGALIPFQQADLRDAGWPIAEQDLAPYVADVERLFSLEPGPYDDPAFPFALGDNHVNRLAKWPEFRKRNVSFLLDGAQGADLQIWLNAHVVEIRTGGQGVSLRAVSEGGDAMAVSARKLIVAAGAIETTRLALLIDRQNGGAVSAATQALGRYFADHISAEVAEIRPTRVRALNRIVGFRFGARGSMRNIRFELAPDAPARADVPPSFCHIGFKVDRPGCFDVLREMFQALQRRKLPPLRVVVNLVAHAPWLLHAVWWRFVEKRLLFPNAARLMVHAVIEQIPRADNRITLNEKEIDRFGLPLAEIDWSIDEADLAHVVATGALFGQTWENTGLALMGRWRSLDAEKIARDLKHSGGIFHPTGSTRMGTGPQDGVVDRDLNLFGVENVQLLATSVLPTGGGANPTMMLLLLAMRCVDQHAGALA